MIPSLAPVSQAQRGPNAPDHLAHAPALDVRASPGQENEEPEGSQSCQQCGKQYNRACDLNKHLKRQNRPFKCPVEVCRYHMFGWPTEQELDRHYNDIHSEEPKVFPCLWQSQNCDYTSKRESNCKQHMEKAHGWNYVRSRPGNRQEEPPKQPDKDLNITHLEAYPRSNLPVRTVPDLTFSPSPLEPCFPTSYGTPTTETSKGAVPFRADVYVPWPSPMTMPGNSGASQEESAEPYTVDPQVASCDEEWLKVVDPMLYNTTPLQRPEKFLTPKATSHRGDLLSISPTIATPQTSPVVNPQVLTPLSEPSPGFRPQLYFEGKIATPYSAETNPGRGASTSWGLRSGNTGRVATPGKRQVQFSKEPDDDSERDDDRPRKRAKAPERGDDELGDGQMPCPFRVAHPEIYDVDKDERYYSCCYTQHDNISTVVRHLGRRAHNLDTDNDRHSISSFNVLDNEHGHPEAGLCKKCWRAFTDSQVFERHINDDNCEKVSRSKREKYEMILNTFCRIESTQRRHLTDEDSGSDDSQGSGESDGGVPVRSDRAPGDEPVGRSEFLALAARLTALERAFSQRTTQVTPRIMPTQADALVSSSSLGSGIQTTQSFDNYAFGAGAGPLTSRPAGPGGIGQEIGPSPAHYGHPAAAAASDRGGGTGEGAGGSDHSSQHVMRAQAAEYGQEGVSQESANTMVRDRWYQAVDASDALLDRVAFFDPPMDDINSYLGMDQQ